MGTNPPSVITDRTSEDGLLGRVACGDRHAFAEFYDLTAIRVFGLIRRVLKDPAQSEEVAQDLFLELWLTASRFDSTRGRALSWALTVAHRRAIDRVRSSQRSRDRDRKVGVRGRLTPRDDVSEAVEISVEYQRVQVAMRGIAAVQCEVIDLTYITGLTQAEIALRIGIPVATVKSRLRAGLIAVRRELDIALPAVLGSVSALQEGAE